jgi:hypothetical protein
MAQKNIQKDDFRFSLIEDFLGYNSVSDKTRLDGRYLIRGSKNVYKKLNGNIASRPGLKRRGAADSTAAGVSSSCEWETSLGTVRNIRVANGKMEVESDIAVGGTFLWYELFLTSTLESLASTFTRFVFDTWWDDADKTDRLVFVRGDSRLLYWSGAIAKVLTSTANTIQLDPSSGFATWAEAGFAITVSGEKKIMIGGREATYTGGESTDTLTGVSMSTGDASTITVGSIAIQSVISQVGGATSINSVSGQDLFPASFAPDFLKIVENQVYVGSYSSRNVFSSNNTAFLDFVNSGSHVYGDPDKIVLDSPCRGFGLSNDGKFVIFGGDSDLYLVNLNENVNVSYTGQDSAAVFNFNKVVKKRLPALQAALAHEFIDNMGEYIVWLDQKNQLRALGTFTNSLVQKPAHLSLLVQEELAEDDFTGGHLRAIVDTIHITAPNTGRDWMYEMRETVNDNGEVVSEKIWQPPQIRGLSRIAMIDGQTHGHSNANPQVYQLWDTEQWFDDSPNDEPIPYTCVMRMAYRHLTEAIGTNVFPRRQGLGVFDKIYFEGYMPEGVRLNANVYYDYQGSKHLLSIPINDPEDENGIAQFFIGSSVPSFGDSSFGDNPLGDGILEESSSQERVPKFRRIVGAQVLSWFEYCIEVYSTEADSRWEILCLGPNVAMAKAKPIKLRK